jgi:hypothetical protein
LFLDPLEAESLGHYGSDLLAVTIRTAKYGYD